MTSISIAVIWCILQVSLLCAVGGLVYLVVRAFEPRLGRTSVAVLLILVTVLTLAALSPWPTWTFLANRQEADAGYGGLEGVRPSTPIEIDGHTATDGTLRSSSQEQGQLLGAPFWQALWDELNRPSRPNQPSVAESSSAGGPWSLAILATLGVAALIGGLRLGAACIALWNWRRASKPIDSPRLKWLASRLQREMGAHGRLDLREATGLQSAATMGWRNPVILLPLAWREWPEEELRAVLAHELAHVRARDWPTWLVAQIAVTLHFYHPLVHWLARRLRLEQELAADATAAAVTGSKEDYLGTLAAQMLRADKARLTWAAQTFLPTRSTIVRRIEMLRSKSPKALSGALPGRAHFAMIGAILAVGLVVAGFRSPGRGASGELGAQEPNRTRLAQNQTPPATPPLSGQQDRMDLVLLHDWSPFGVYSHIADNDAVFLLVARPRAIFASDEMAPLRAQINQLLAENNREVAGLQIEELDTVALSPYGPSARIVLSFDKPIANSSFQIQWAKYQEVEKVGNFSLRTLSGSPQGPAAMTWGDERVVFDGSYEGLKTLATRFALEQYQRPQWLQDAPRPKEGAAAWLAINMDVMRRESAKIPADQQQNMPLAMIKPLIEKPRAVSFTAVNAPSLEVSGVAVCNSEADAAQVVSTAQAIVTLARNMLAEQLRAAPPEGTPQAMIVGTVTMADKFLQSAKFGAVGSEAHVTFAGGSLGQQLIQMSLVLPAIQSAREAARRTQGMNNLKQLALAMLTYEDVHGHFPPPVVTGPDGKTKHSWRVAILPYMDQPALYDEYRLTEPWDSEHNLKLLERIPAVFRSPTEPAGTTTSSYYVLVGKETMFPPMGQGVKLGDIADGTSKTIMIVETKRDTPWTKPDDIAYAPDQPLPPLGDYHDGIISVAFADGSAQVVQQQTDQAILRRMIEKADGQPVQR